MAVKSEGSASISNLPTPIAPNIAPGRPPPLEMKPVVATESVAPSRPCSIMSKEWIIPPRPKPGRKPATDMPPTKRKAQNRAAQRAFRERRAARVGELEEHLKMVEDENDQEQAELRSQIENLTRKLNNSHNELEWWQKRCQTLSAELETQKKTKDLTKSQEQPPPPPPPPVQIEPDLEMVPNGCENCSHTVCQCINDAFDITFVSDMNTETNTTSKRPLSPGLKDSSKRQRNEPVIKIEQDEELEVDFTSRFYTPKPLKRDGQPPTLLDPCGFCQDGTPCICAEMAVQEQQTEAANLPEYRKRLPSIQALTDFTPPPSDGDSSSDSLPAITSLAKKNPCANGAGTCSQCLSDPRRTLFCKSLAAARPSLPELSRRPSGCCGGGGPGGGCCKDNSKADSGGNRNNNNNNNYSNTNGNAQANTTDSRSGTPLTLSCADTYTTLSRHPKFSQATSEIDSWVPRLHPLPPPRSDIDTRPAMEVEAASVMGVLRYFDRRFAD